MQYLRIARRQIAHDEWDHVGTACSTEAAAWAEATAEQAKDPRVVDVTVKPVR